MHCLCWRYNVTCTSTFKLGIYSKHGIIQSRIHMHLACSPKLLASSFPLNPILVPALVFTVKPPDWWQSCPKCTLFDSIAWLSNFHDCTRRHAYVHRNWMDVLSIFITTHALSLYLHRYIGTFPIQPRDGQLYNNIFDSDMESQLLYRLRYRLQCSKVLFEGRNTWLYQRGSCLTQWPS